MADKEKEQKDKEKEAERIQKYDKWYESEYTKLCGVPSDFSTFRVKYSSIFRQETYSNMRFNNMVSKTDFYVVSIRLLRTGRTSIVYNPNVQYNSIIGYLYYVFKDNKPSLEFYCFGPTYNSADGEYRPIVMPYNNVDYVKKKYEVIELYEEYTLQQLKSGDIRFQTCITGTDQKLYKKIENHIDSSRILIYMYIFNYIGYKGLYIEKAVPNHLAPGFIESVFSKDFVKFNKITQELDKPSIRIDLSRFSADPTDGIKVLEIGQKIRHITVHEAENIGDMNLPTWREIKIASEACDLVLNVICPGFPLFNDWFIVENDNPEIWNNKVSIMKMEHSDIAKKALRELENARRNTFILDPINKQELYISRQLENLSDVIEIPMDIAERDMVLSKYFLGYFCEHNGTTFADLPRFLLNIKPYNIFNNFDLFSKCIFEYLYAFYSLNEKLGVVHGDAHLNNITYFGKFTFHAMKYEANGVKDPKVVYCVNGKNYVFPTLGKFGGLIDFSRSFKNEHTEINRLRMLNLLESEVSTFFEDNKREIKILSMDEPDEFYHMFKAIDPYKTFRAIETFMENQFIISNSELTTKEMAKKMVTLVRNIKDSVYDYITNFIKNKPKINPSLMLIEKYFASFVMKEEDLKTPAFDILDYFSDRNELKYHGYDYNQFPPLLKFDYIVENDIPTDAQRILNFKKMQEDLKKHNPQDDIEEIMQEQRNEKEERRGMTSKPTKTDTTKKKEIEKDMSSGDWYLS